MAKYYLYPDGTNATGASVSTVGAASPYLALDDPQGAPSDSDYVYSSANGSGGSGAFSVTFAAMASLVSVNYIKLWGRCAREAGAGGTDVQIQPFIITSATTYNGVSAFVPGTSYALTLLGTWTTNPYTGVAWTKTDLDAIKAGADMWDPAVTYRAPGMSTLFIEVDYVPAPEQIGPARVVGSQLLRLFRKPVATMQFSLPARYADVQVGDDLDITHAAIPHPTSGYGAGDKVWERRIVRVMSSEFDMDSGTVNIKAMDLRYGHYLTNLWDTCETDEAPGGVDDGVARLDLGAGRTFTRASSAWVPDPSDGRVVALADNNAKLLYAFGTALENATTNLILNSDFHSGVASSWTRTGTGSGGSAITDDTSTRLFDTSVSSQSAVITTGNPNTVDTYLAQTVTASAQVNYVVSFDYKLGTATEVCWRLQNSAGNYLNWSTQSWGASVWNPVIGGTAPTFSDATLPNGFKRVGYKFQTPKSITGLTLHIGLRSTDGNSKTVNIGHVQIEGGATTWDSMTSRIVTSGSTYTRAVDYLYYGDSVSKKTYPWEKGTVSLYFAPMWTGNPATTKNIWRFQNDSGGNNADLLFIDSSGNLTLRRRVNAVNYTITYAGTWTYRTWYHVAYRMIGPETELDDTAYTLELFLNGVSVGTVAGTYFNELITPSAGLYLGGSSAGSSGDAYFKNLLVVPWALTDEEIANL
jgi:hypothetical protein